MQVIYEDYGFNFLGLRFEQRDKFILHGLGGKIKFDDLQDLNNFIDVFEVTARNFLTCRDYASYGTLMRIYRDEGKIMLWYNKQTIEVPEKQELRHMFLALKKIAKRWKVNMAKVKMGEIADGEALTVRV